MTSLARAFVAVSPPPDVVDALAGRLHRARALGAHLRWGSPDQWHVTLRFLGRVPDPTRLVAALRRAVDGAASFRVRLAGTGAFPTVRRGAVVWVGVDDPDGALHRLADDVDRACADAEFAPDDRPFRAHLTVARAPRAGDLRSVVAAIDPAPVASAWNVDEVRLVESDTQRSGAVHRVVERFPLQP